MVEELHNVSSTISKNVIWLSLATLYFSTRPTSYYVGVM